jgi:hypothetical protein
MENIDRLVNELHKFSPSIISFEAPVDKRSILDFHVRHNLTLPTDYIHFLEKNNGTNLFGTIIYGVATGEPSTDLEMNYKFEHHEVGNPMQEYLVPFSPDGGGNHYCFDTRKCDENSCLVVFWQHNYTYSNEDPPAVVNNSFAEWLKEVVIDWTLEDYDYSGNKKTS